MPESRTPANAGRKYPAEPLTEAEVRQLLDAVPGRGPLALRNRALVALLWATGLRIAEAVALYPRDLDDALTTARVREGKGRKARVAAWREGADYKAHVRAWLDCRRDLGLNGRQPVFCSVASGQTREPGQPLDPSQVRRLLPKLARRAGIDKRVHPHGLRHSHATSLAADGVPLPVIAGQLGHESTATTDTYLAKIDPSERIKAIRRLTAQGDD
jgi:site-specific recombinase XerD